MATITRQEFKVCIEAGIAAAGDDFSDADRENLRNYAATASSFGLNFSTYCPMHTCGFVPDTDAISPAAGRFAAAFDRAWSPLLSLEQFHEALDADRIGVR